MRIELPEGAVNIISALESRGFEAYAVGGCVRDSLLGNTPVDWDICTSAAPEQTKEVFRSCRVIDTGLRYGGVTLILNGGAFEVTAFRADGAYSDNRRPDVVTFVGNLREDLSRRDFTINAMAYNPRTGVVDYFGGADDLGAKVIRCVGDAGARLREDALRILRALRFASCLGFEVEPKTAAEAVQNAELLKNIAAERVSAELNRLLTGVNAGAVMREFAPVMGVVMQDADFQSSSPDAAPPDLTVRLALLFNSAEAAENTLRGLKYDTRTIAAVRELSLWRGAEIPPDEKHVKRWLNRLGEDMFRKLLALKEADGAEIDPLREISDKVVGSGQCFTLKALAVSGNDLLATGVPEGPAVGAALNRLLDMVIDGGAANDREALLERVRESSPADRR